MTSIEKELTSPNFGDLMAEFYNEESPAPWYVATRAAEAFRDQHGRLPGEKADQVESDFNLLKGISTELMT
jgi:hypothetical protein